MLLEMLKSKIHRATVTEANLDYQGSITIDRALLRRAGILQWEKVAVYNLANGNRFETYAIEGPENSGVICLNGAAALLARPGDLVIVAAYARMTPEDGNGTFRTYLLDAIYNMDAETLEQSALVELVG